ncbi:TPA: FAD-dependent monooxygenase [Klebsiella pneumoniae]|uniref:FAD-dependent monooxygenase n=1 Tax=Klebsiella TaxID=570 RepID=UPI0004E40D7C|nr:MULTISPECIES: FAD-dependent monooxygenase [Klebsiella]KFC37965.1 hypothetical protein FF19_20315 [Klebsiella michiganensis]HBQ5629222.1 FAD-dependent monooxygenase [Klebsiella pneumoniae]HBR4718678.1 FAD-dependent monooxygenase [Klebsiella pneumoniae]HCA7148941.1 FAD-dependent monooxygenase [Klebsiella pneumoniae]
MLSKHVESVLIVGGGPVGMLIALELNLFGIKSRIISKHERYSPHSKATIVWPRILEILDRTGVAEKILSNGHYFDQMNYYSNKKLVGNIRFDNLKYMNYPFGITVPQWKTEKALEDTLNEQGIYINYNYEFLNGENNNDHIVVEIKGPNGAVTNESYQWVIGADGFSSKVRECFGFQFDGFSMETRLAITDAEIVNEVTGSEVGYYLHKTGNMVLAPIGDGIFRVGASVPKEYNGNIDREFFDNLLKIRVPGSKKLGEMKFCGIFNAHVRSASSFKKGRVLLAGDAAHVMSPSGAQGLNSGFQDAVNLGWKLAGVILGRYNESLLDTYSEERTNSIKRVSKLSTFLANVSLYKNSTSIMARDFSFKIASKVGILDKYFSPLIAQLDTPLGDLKIGRNIIEPGRRIPIQWGKSRAAPLLGLTQYTIVFWPGISYSYLEWKKFIDDVKENISNFELIDLGGKPLGMLRDFLTEKGMSIIVRPDGYVSDVIHLDSSSYHDSISEIESNLSKLNCGVNHE